MTGKSVSMPTSSPPTHRQLFEMATRMEEDQSLLILADQIVKAKSDSQEILQGLYQIVSLPELEPLYQSLAELAGQTKSAFEYAKAYLSKTADFYDNNNLGLDVEIAIFPFESSWIEALFDKFEDGQTVWVILQQLNLAILLQ